MQKVLMFNIKGKKSVDIKMICHKLHISAESVDSSMFGCKLEFLLGISEDDICKTESCFDDEMLLFAGFNNTILDIMLSQLRQKKARVDLKAVLTETNKSFTPYDLCVELKAEREAIKKGSQLHQT